VIFNNKDGAAVQNALMMSTMLDNVLTHQKRLESTY